MAKKSRRLPGGKVRKPLAQRPRPVVSGTAPTSTPFAEPLDEDDDEALEEEGLDEELEEEPVVARAPARTGAAVGRPPATPTGARPATQMGGRPATLGATGSARPGTAVASRAAAIDQRRVGVGARRTGVTGAPRRSAALMDLAAANYSHVRSDLARIGVIAVIMLGIIIALSFVLPNYVK